MPDLAEAIKGWFPELKGRVLAVSEADVTAENVPTLPLCMLALVRETADHSWRHSIGNIDLQEVFMVEFWLPPERHKTEGGGETPFWTFYDYPGWRDRFLKHLTMEGWEDETGHRIQYTGMTIDADHFAVVLTFSFVNHSSWCPPEDQDNDCKPAHLVDGKAPKLSFSLEPAGQLPCEEELICDKETDT